MGLLSLNTKEDRNSRMWRVATVLMLDNLTTCHYYAIGKSAVKRMLWRGHSSTGQSAEIGQRGPG